MTTDTPKPQGMTRVVHLVYARDELATTVRKLQLSGITDAEIKAAFDIVTAKEEQPCQRKK